MPDGFISIIRQAEYSFSLHAPDGFTWHASFAVGARALGPLVCPQIL
jgi:hypothetical protein